MRGIVKIDGIGKVGGTGVVGGATKALGRRLDGVRGKLGEFFAEPSARPMQFRLNGGNGCADFFRNFLITPIFRIF